MHVTAWLYTLVQNACLDQLRRRRATAVARACAAAESAEDEALQPGGGARARLGRPRAAGPPAPRGGARRRRGTFARRGRSLPRHDRSRLAVVAEAGSRDLIAMADARSIPCSEVRAAIDGAVARDARLTAVVGRHVADCEGCHTHHYAMRCPASNAPRGRYATWRRR